MLLHCGHGRGAAHKISEQHAGKFQVIDVVTLALGEADVFDALALAAHALELRVALSPGRR